MARILVVSILSGLLSACAGMPDWTLVLPSKDDQTLSTVSHFSFAWRLSGDRAVAPIQAFDNGIKTWLQFAPKQPLPAVFEHTTAGDRPLKYTHEGPYMVLNGVWPKLILRGGRLQSRVERIVEPPVEPVAAVTPIVPAVTPVIVAPTTSPVLHDAASVMAFQVPGITDEPPQRYTVSPKDLNLRSALARWAQSAGWTFQPEHWAVDADIPIVASANFEPGFKLAVQDLVATTELADRPLQPCFYSNRVLRIVPYAQQCDRTVAGVGAS